PLVRKPYFHLPNDVKKNVMVRHLTNVKSLFPVTEDEDEIANALITEKARSLIVMGQPGSGKGTLGQTIATRDKFGQFDKSFFATAHFSNDFLCMIDAAANYFSEGANTSKPDGVTSPLTRFEKALKSGRNLFVMGGLERLLVPCSVDRVLKIRDPLK